MQRFKKVNIAFTMPSGRAEVGAAVTFYCKIAEPIVEDLTPYAGWLYTVLVRLIPRQINALPITREKLAAAAHMSIRSVVRYTHVLETKGLIAVQRGQKPGAGKAEVNVYSLAGAYASVAQGRDLKAQAGGDSEAHEAVPVGHGESRFDSRSDSMMDDIPYLQSLSELLGIEPNAAQKIELRQLYRELGHDRYRDVMERCKAKQPKRWSYVLTSLRNEIVPETQQSNLLQENRDSAIERDDAPSPHSPPSPTDAAPPGMPPIHEPDPCDDMPCKEVDTDINQNDIPTEPDVETDSTIEIAPEQIVWEQVMMTLENTLGAGVFQQLLSGLKLDHVEDNVWFVIPRSAEQAFRLQDHRLIRDLRRAIEGWTMARYEDIGVQVLWEGEMAGGAEA